MPTQTQQIPIRFIAHRRGLRLVRKAQRPQYDSHGDRVGTTDGVVVEFTDGVLDVVAGERELDGEDLLTWLRNHPSCNQHEGFYEFGFAPESVPDSGETLVEVAAATAERDVKELASILEVEREGFGRQPVLDACEAALRALGGPEAA